MTVELATAFVRTRSESVDDREHDTTTRRSFRLVRHGTHEQCVGHGGAVQASLVKRPADCVEPAESDRERQPEQEPGEHPDTEAANTELLEQVVQVAVVPFRFCLTGRAGAQIGPMQVASIRPPSPARAQRPHTPEGRHEPHHVPVRPTCAFRWGAGESVRACAGAGFVQ